MAVTTGAAVRIVGRAVADRPLGAVGGAQRHGRRRTRDTYGRTGWVFRQLVGFDEGGVTRLAGDEPRTDQIDRRVQPAIDEDEYRAAVAVGKNRRLSDLPGGLEPGQHEHQRDGQKREDEAENQRCALALHRIELHPHTVVRQRSRVSPVPEKVRRHLESTGQIQSHDSIPYLRVGPRRAADSGSEGGIHRCICSRLLSGCRGGGYAGAFAALSRLPMSCRKASGEVGQTLVQRVPSGPVV